MSQAKPLVSIVIINHNYGRYVGEAIESALYQTYRPLEIIVVDDGSTDDSLEIIQNYPVKLVMQENKGVAVAVDTGIRACRGDYYVLLSADDILHPDYVMKTLSALRSKPEAAFAYTYAFLFGATSGVLKSKEYNLTELLKANYIPGTALVRLSSYYVVGGYDPELPILEDWDHWLMFAEHGLYGILVPEPLFYWRRHAQGSRNTQSRAVVKKAIHKIRKKHRQLQPTYFWIADLSERGVIKAFHIAKKMLCMIRPELAEWFSESFGKALPKRGAEIIPVPSELSTPNFDFLSKRCCSLNIAEGKS